MSILQMTLQDASSFIKSNGNNECESYTQDGHESATEARAAEQQVLHEERIQALKIQCSKTAASESVFSLNEPRIFTPQFVSELGMVNSQFRVQRNSWVVAVLKDMLDRSIEPLVVDEKRYRSFGPAIVVHEANSIRESV